MNSVTLMKNRIIGTSAIAMLTCTAPKLAAKTADVIIPHSGAKVEQVLTTNPVARGLRDNLLYGIPSGAVSGGVIGFLTSIGTGVKKKKEILQHTLEGASTSAQFSAVIGPFISTMLPGLAGGLGTSLQTGIVTTTVTFTKRVHEQTLKIAEEIIEQARKNR